MIDLWTSLVPLVIGSAVVPLQIVVTVLLLRSASGRTAAAAFVAGMTTVRVMQGLVFGFLLESADSSSTDPDGPGLVASVLLLVVAVLFLASAAKAALKQPDEDAPPPSWMARIEGVGPAGAFGLGAAALLISAKVWVFTLSAIAVIADAALGAGASIGTYVLFVVLAQSVHFGLLFVAYAVPDRSATIVGGVAAFLERRNRLIMIVLGTVFGAWFAVKALTGLGVL